MKILIAGLVAGLILSLSLSASAHGRELSASARELSCTSTLNGRVLRSEYVMITEEVTELDMGSYKDVKIFGQVVMNQVSVYMDFDGVLFGSIGSGVASYSMYILGEGELSLFCHI